MSSGFLQKRQKNSKKVPVSGDSCRNRQPGRRWPQGSRWYRTFLAIKAGKTVLGRVEKTVSGGSGMVLFRLGDLKKSKTVPVWYFRTPERDKKIVKG
jgi:hypothetical protein